MPTVPIPAQISISVPKNLPLWDFSIMTLITAIIELTEFNPAEIATEMEMGFAKEIFYIS